MISRRFRIGVLLGSALGVSGLVLPAVVAGPSAPVVRMLFMFVLLGLGIPAVMLRRMMVHVERPALPTPERPAPPEIPGESFDGMLADAAVDRDGEPTYALEKIHDRLREVAVETLVNERQLTAEAARQRIEDGSWGDDQVAAAFLQRPPGEHPVLRGTVGRFRTGPTNARVAVERTVAALVRMTGRTPIGDRPRSFRERVGELVRGTHPRREDGGYTVVPTDHTVRLSDRWHGVSALALFGIGVGVGFGSRPMFVLGAIGVGYATYARSALLPRIDVSATRTLSDESPEPDDEVSVTVSVQNEGRYPLPDVRLVDGVPEALGVTGGAPQHATTIPPGESATFEYTIQARRGHHEFGPVRVLARDLAEVIEHDLTVPAETTFACEPSRSVSEQVLRRDVTRFVGGLPTESGGDGIEFHSTRDYRRGDPLRRIDWNRLARTGEFATVEFNEERAASVILVVDGRASAYAAARSDATSAYERSIRAAVRSVPRLRRDGNAVGLAGLSPTPCWVAPTSNRVIEARIEECLATHPAFAPTPPTDRCYTGAWLDQFRRRFDRSVQVVFCSPIRDLGAVNVARSLETYGYAVTVISPDPTTLSTVGTQLATLERQIRLHELRRAGIRVVDWTADEPLDVATLRAARRWSR